jgi:hypothetical protein
MPNLLIALGPAIGSGIGYFHWNRSALAGAVGAVAGYFAYPLLEIGAIMVPIPFSILLPSAVGGALVASGYYGSSGAETLAIGAVAGAGTQVALARLDGIAIAQLENPLNGFHPGGR